MKLLISHLLFILFLYYNKANSRKIKKTNQDNLLRQPFDNQAKTTSTVRDIITFKDKFNKWDFKLLNQELNEVFEIFLNGNSKELTKENIKSIIDIFLKDFEECDKSKNNLLTLNEFISCLNDSEYFKIFKIDISVQPNYMIKMVESNKNYTNISNTNQTSEKIFELLNDFQNDQLNFYNYMQLRLISFALRKCKHFGFFIDEIKFECALEIITKHKTLQRNSARRLFKFGLELSNFQNVRSMDLLSFIKIALTSRLYAKIDVKENNDLSKSQLQFALDKNILPKRYNEDIIIAFLNLVYDNNKSNLDMFSFIFLDTLLVHFDNYKNSSTKNINFDEFDDIINSYEFPKQLIEDLYYIPQFPISKDNYTSFISANISKVYNEKDFLLKYKFKETPKKTVVVEEIVEEIVTTTTKSSNKVKIQAPINEEYKRKNFNNTNTLNKIFNVMKNIDSVNFEDFAYFIQIAYLFKKFDKFKKGRLDANYLLDKYLNYDEYPKIKHVIRERAEKFKYLYDDTKVDLFFTYVILKIEDLIEKSYSSKSLEINLTEIEIKSLFDRISIVEFPIVYINSCIKGKVLKDTRLPNYELTCSITKAIQLVCNYYDAVTNKKIVENKNIELVNTEIKLNN